MTFDNKRNTVRHHGGKVGANGKRGGQHYAAVPVELARDPKITHAARSVAVYVWSHDEKWQQSISAVATALGTDRKTVAAALASLQEAGWLVREKLGTNRERWHLQLSNIRFSTEEVARLSSQDEEKLPSFIPPGTEEKLPTPLEGMGRISPTPWGETPQHAEEKIPMKVVDLEVHPEVHFSSARTHHDETAPFGRSLAVVGRTEATGVADGRGQDGPSLSETGLQSPVGEYDCCRIDPFCEHNQARWEPSRGRVLEPATAAPLPVLHEDPFA